MGTHLSRDVGGEPIQAVPLRKDFVNLSENYKVLKPRLVYCVTGGDIVITWGDATTSTITLTQSDYFPIDGASSLMVSATTVIHAGGKQAGFTVPTAFSFTDLTDQVASTLLTSNAITVAAIGVPMAISLVQTEGVGSYRINGGAWRTTASVVNLGDTVELQATSPALSTDPSTSMTLSIGTIDDVWTIATIA